MPQQKLDDALEQLVRAELIFRRGTPPDAEYTYKHALVQDAAYDTLLRSNRQQLHARIATAMESKFPEVVTSTPEVLAQHYTAAGVALQAIPYWLKAGQAALQRSTLTEATSHLTKGLELIPLLANEKIRAGLELELQATLALALSGSKGFAVPEVEQAYIRARALCDQIGSTPQLFPVLWGLFLFHWVRGHLETARSNADEMLRIAEQANDAALLLISHFSLGSVLWHIGDNRAALFHLLQAQTQYNEKAHAPLASAYGQDFGVWTLSYLEHVQLSLGYPEKGARAIGEALALGRRLNHPLSLCNALTFNALSCSHRRDPASTHKFSEELRRLAGEHGFPQYQALAALNGGWALAHLGSANEGVELGQQGNFAWHALGADVALPLNLTAHAESQLAAGQTRAALETTDQALSWVDKNGEHAHECYRPLLPGRYIPRTRRTRTRKP